MPSCSATQSCGACARCSLMSKGEDDLAHTLGAGMPGAVPDPKAGVRWPLQLLLSSLQRQPNQAVRSMHARRHQHDRLVCVPSAVLVW